MDPQVQHDPRTKQAIKEALYEHLYTPIKRAFQKRIDELITKNCLLMRYSHKSFNYKGEFYHSDGPPFPRKANRLSPTLTPDMEAYLADLKELNDREIPYVLGFINQVLNASNDFHDYLSVFPPSLHPPIHQFIAACPCRTKHLSPDEIQDLQIRNSTSIHLIKSRMVTNLLI